MICYASRTGTRRNLNALRAAGWRLLISRAGVWRSEGFPYAIDNGAWSDFQAGNKFDGPAFARMIDKLGQGADWAVLPDIVAGGMESLRLSICWEVRVRACVRRVLYAVQDGMTPADLVEFVGPDVGIFLGGSTEWKLAQMETWGKFCAERGAYYHVARVNTEKRFALAIGAGAHSVDGSSASRFSNNLSRLARAASQQDLFTP